MRLTSGDTSRMSTASAIASVGPGTGHWAQGDRVEPATPVIERHDQRHPIVDVLQFADGVGGQDRTAQQRGSVRVVLRMPHRPQPGHEQPGAVVGRHEERIFVGLALKSRGRSSTRTSRPSAARQRYDLTDDRNELFCAAVSAQALNNNGPCPVPSTTTANQTQRIARTRNCGSSSGFSWSCRLTTRHHHGERGRRCS